MSIYTYIDVCVSILILSHNYIDVCVCVFVFRFFIVFTKWYIHTCFHVSFSFLNFVVSTVSTSDVRMCVCLCVGV